jgi:hypothetical protein
MAFLDATVELATKNVVASIATYEQATSDRQASPVYLAWHVFGGSKDARRLRAASARSGRRPSVPLSRRLPCELCGSIRRAVRTC